MRLGLTSGVATSQTGLSGSVTAPIDNTVTYQSHSGVIDPGEPGPADARVNSEVARLDDVGLVTEGSDAKLNIDFNNNAEVILKIPGGGFTSLMIAEDAGLDPFKLERCATASCSGTQVLFDAPLDGWLRISETRNFGGTRLEVDFVGGADPLAAVPEPTTFLLWGTTAAGLALARWRRRYRGTILRPLQGR